MKTIITIAVSIVISFVNSNVSSLKEEAMSFSLEYVKTLFDKSCEKNFNMMSDSILTMNGGEALAKSIYKGKICMGVQKAVKPDGKTYEDYIENYTIEILTRLEVEKKYNSKFSDSFSTLDNDFFFLGHKLKPGIPPTENFIWDDMFIFMVRKENGIWVLKAVSG